MVERRIQRNGRKTEKQGRYFTQESESVPGPRHFETFIPRILHPPSPLTLPPNPEQGDIPEEQSHPAWIWFCVASHEALKCLSERRLSHCTHRSTGLHATPVTPQCERKAVQFPLRVQVWSHLAESWLWLRLWHSLEESKYYKICQTEFHDCRVLCVLKLNRLQTKWG